ncbi:hypothetical protein MNBD_PLANCTO03-1023 [hydrothermal vent metagenome]|uniref:Uncharacterized protein n=1 Tax=hydrothermal vent metagenome TaxID=652676 RepID=A0A3B1E0K4_9ZZZZ
MTLSKIRTMSGELDTPHTPHAPHAWLAAARDPQIAGELELLYEHIGREVARHQPRCTQSGRCCNFDAWGHRLYVTGLEAAYLFSRLEQQLTADDITRSLARGGCPFQRSLLCAVHAIRPLGCRVYYCDQSGLGWQEALTERTLAEVCALHDRHDIPYHYGEWRTTLEMLVNA